MDARTIDLVRSPLNLCGGSVCSAETGPDELLAVLAQQIKCGQMCTCRYLDQLGESVSDLGLRQGVEK